MPSFGEKLLCAVYLPYAIGWWIAFFYLSWSLTKSATTIF